jgi:hypothetical protein
MFAAGERDMRCFQTLARGVNDYAVTVIVQSGYGCAAYDLGAASRGGIEQQLIEAEPRQAGATKRQRKFCPVVAEFEAELGERRGPGCPDVDPKLGEVFLRLAAEEFAADFVMLPGGFFKDRDAATMAGKLDGKRGPSKSAADGNRRRFTHDPIRTARNAVP